MRNAILIFISLTFLFTSSCDLIDQCMTVTCANGGVCDEGSCDCPVGFSGEFCESIQNPRFVKFKNILIASFPLSTPQGYAWDNGSKPDIQVRLFMNDNWVTTTNVAYNVLLNVPLQVEGYGFKYNVEDLIKVQLGEVDGSKFTPIGAYTFFPINFASGSPNEIEVYDANTQHKIRMRISTEWIY